jgi:uracil DNA glycosylase
MIQLDSSWLQYLSGEFEKEYMKEIKSFLVSEISK